MDPYSSGSDDEAPEAVSMGQAKEDALEQFRAEPAVRLGKRKRIRKKVSAALKATLEEAGELAPSASDLKGAFATDSAVADENEQLATGKRRRRRRKKSKAEPQVTRVHKQGFDLMLSTEVEEAAKAAGAAGGEAASFLSAELGDGTAAKPARAKGGKRKGGLPLDALGSSTFKGGKGTGHALLFA
jgi:hypothetical protein